MSADDKVTMSEFLRWKERRITSKDIECVHPQERGTKYCVETFMRECCIRCCREDR